ncbi:MAG: hypothetical protein AAF329_11105 [Cyanobacteria bacterium P01_A01_bin.17]
MLRRKIDSFDHNQINIFDYKMFSVMVMIGGISVLSLAYTLNHSCIAYSQASQTAWVDKEASRSVSDIDASPGDIDQQSQEFVFKYSDGSEKIVDIPNKEKNTKIREGIMFRHNAARQGI